MITFPFRRQKIVSTIVVCILPFSSWSQTQMPAELRGHAIFPAKTFLLPPADAPRDAFISGKFTGPGNLREDRPGSIMGRTGPEPQGRETGLSLPFKGQPLQGFSSMKTAGNGDWWLLTDNGFGNQRNSADALLMWHRAKPDFTNGNVAVHATTYLRDPDGKIPFRITYQGTKERYLTGADLDVESLVVIGETVWLGDEFGAYLIRADLSVLAFDPVAARWTGESAKYSLEKEAAAIGDLNMIDATRALVIERDDGQGDPTRVCPPSSRNPLGIVGAFFATRGYHGPRLKATNHHESYPNHPQPIPPHDPGRGLRHGVGKARMRPEPQPLVREGAHGITRDDCRGP